MWGYTPVRITGVLVIFIILFYYSHLYLSSLVANKKRTTAYNKQTDGRTDRQTHKDDEDAWAYAD